MSLQTFFPFIPEGSDWQTWNGNLIMFFSEEPIPYVEDDTQWRMVAKNVSQLPTFEVYPVPDPDLYQNWQPWASEFTLIINGPSQ
jgi:hypothetical protein